MADENKPAFYPRVGRNIAKNFRSAQPPAFIEDPRAMDLPQYGDIDLSVPSRENLEMARRMAERDAQLKRQQQADRSPLEKLAGGVQAGRFLGSALTQAINSAPTRLFKGDEAADKFMQERMYKPEQPLAYEYAGDVGDFLEKLETEYKLPPVLPEAVALQYLTAPATSQAMRTAGKGAQALERRLDPMVTQALERGGLQRDLLLGLGQGTQSNVIKPKGGNWLTGGVEKQLGRLKMADKMNPEWYADRERWLEEAIAKGDERAVRAIKEDVEVGRRNDAISNWIDSNLTNYVKKEMATPEDPVRKLAEQGVLHIQPYGDQYEVSRRLMNKRSGAGFPPLGMGKNEPARFWERQADISVEPYPAGSYKHGALDESILTDNPWLQNVPDETMVNYAKGLNDLGFDHIIDVLRQDVREGRIRPEQLNKVSMEQAVRRTFEYDQEMARKMRETALKQQEGFPVHKEYPEGYKWIELAPPKELPAGYSVVKDDMTGSFKVVDASGKEAVDRPANQLGHINVPFHKTEEEAIADALKYDKRLEEALKYEGDTMGHCVGGYCPDVIAGRSRIFSLRDAKGEPHVTVEVEPESRIGFRKGEGPQNVADEYTQKTEWLEGVQSGKIGNDVTFAEWWRGQNGIPEPERPMKISQIKGKQNAAPKADYLPYVQDFVKSGKWSHIGDFKNTGLIREGDQIMTPAEHADWLLKQLDVPPAEGMKRGGVAISKNPDAMMLELNNQKMKNGVPAYAGGKAVTKMGLKAAASEAERALPLRLTRAMPKPLSEINAHAERVARQMMGEHVTSGKAGDTKNLAGRSMKESQRVKGLEYELVPTKDVPESQVVEAKLGDINVALPGDFTVSDVELKSLMGEPIGSRQEGGSRYGLGHLEDELPLFYASNEGPAQQVQNKVTELAELYGPERVMGHHMAMGPIATNFAQHFADANLRRIDYSKLRPADMYQFDKILSEGFVIPKTNKKTGETTYKVVDFPDWPGIVDPQAAYFAMKQNPEMRKWFNKLMQTPKITEPLGLPNAQDVRYAITSPDLRDMEVNLTGHGVGELVPNAELTDTANHNTYLKGIRGIYKGHQDVLTPFPISFADAAQHIISTQRPQDFTGTIQKVFPHQIVDQQYLDELGAYRKRIKELTGKKEGGAIKQPAAYIDGNEFVEAAKKYGIKDSMNNLNKIVDLVNKGLTVDDAARQVADTGMHKAAGGAITGDDLIIEERPL